MRAHLSAFLQAYGAAAVAQIPPHLLARAMLSSDWPPHRPVGTPSRGRRRRLKAKLSGAKGLRP